MGCDEQDGVPVSMGKMQRQPLLQGLLTPQLPPQVAVPFACICNCCASTSTQNTHDERGEKGGSSFFLHDSFFLCLKPHRYFPGAATPAGRVVQNAVNGVVKEQKQPVAQA